MCHAITSRLVRVRAQRSEGAGACDPPLRAWRPTLRMGDVALFDYRALHRGGANASPQLRTLLYLTFARSVAQPAEVTVTFSL